ncbi:uncharacterized protein [Primulina eburnea]|uniref:uncharacterized protein n=1 Tax=Primulina eburnea TaxID=1245227 RepID=UPI003C6C5A19
MAKACWEELGIWNLVVSKSNEVEGFIQWLFKMFQQVDVESLENIAMVLWGIWRARNEKIWNRIVRPADSIVSSAIQFLTDWKAVRNITTNPEGTTHREVERFPWIKPQAPTLKCNVDASVQNGSGLFGVGMVLRDYEGVFVSARTNAFPGRALVKEAEAMAIKEALSWIMEMNIQEAIFESDAKGVTEALNSTRDDDSEFGAIILECRELLRQRPSFRVCFTRR